jgi:LacI family transcriptional regulator
MVRVKQGRSSRVTLANVAERVGVSVTTVSLILSGREEWLCQFNPDTVEKVRHTAERLGYRANLFASGLPTKASVFFALVVHEIGGSMAETWHHWAFEGAFMGGVIQRATEREVYPILTTAGPDADEERLKPVQQIIDGGVFGSIVRTPNAALERFLRARHKRGQRVVVVFPPSLGSWPTNAIDVDNVSVGETAGRLLAARGRKRWVFVRYTTMRDTHGLRLKGLTEISRRCGATIQTLRLPMGLTEYTAATFAVPRLKKVGADGVFSVDSVSSVASLLGCVEAGMRPAEDFDLVGCDCSLWRGDPLPAPTSVDVSWKDVGILAMDKLLDLTGSGAHVFETEVLTPRVVAAGTCPVPAGFKPVPAGDFGKRS